MASGYKTSSAFDLGGLWGDSDEEEGEGEEFVNAGNDATVTLAGDSVRVWETSFHPQNANQVWPGNHHFSGWLAERWETLPLQSGPVLELGAATGALAAWLVMRGTEMVTTDVADGGDVASSISATFALNELPTTHVHVEHTWGEPVPVALLQPAFSLVLAVDILLYVKAYPDLLKTLGGACFPTRCLCRTSRPVCTARFFSSFSL